jgi:hypothetical protein
MPERKANFIDYIFGRREAIKFPSRSIAQQKGPGNTGAFLLNGWYFRRVLQTKIRQVAVAMRNIGIRHQDPIKDRQEAREKAGRGDQVERGKFGGHRNSFGLVALRRLYVYQMPTAINLFA